MTSLLGWRNPGTALVTGASAGLGASFARRLAGCGFDLLLTARREDRLRGLAESLSSEHGVRCRVLAADLSQDTGIQRVAEAVRGITDLDVVVNNAGFGMAGTFMEAPIGKSLSMLTVHAAAVMQVTHAALAVMRPRGRGAIVNVASMAAFVVTAGDAVYEATKSFLVTFSEALALETRGSGIRVQALCPGFTRTEFHEVGDLADFDRDTIPRGLWMDADNVTEMSLAALGRSRKTVFIPGWKNRAATWLVRRCGVVRRLVQNARRK